MNSVVSTFENAATEQRAAGRGSAVFEFLIVGGGTLLLIPLLWLLRRVIGLDSAELAVGFLMFHAAHVINDPHFAVTYLLFYKGLKRRAFGATVCQRQRARFWLAGFAVPLGLSAWIAYALSHGSAAALGSLVELMFFLVGWHYVKQGFGVLSVLCARRGVRFTSFERCAILGHCFAGWAYAWASPAALSREVAEKGVIYRALPHPARLEAVALCGLVLSTLLLVLVLYCKWRRERRLPPLVPFTSFFVSIWVWTIYMSVDPLLVYVIPALHSLQYLYFVGLLRHNLGKAEEQPPWFGAPSRQRLAMLAGASLGLGWLLFHGAPELLDAARVSQARHAHEPLGDLGATPYFAAFFAFVNIHHYFMDTVIWRRENPDMRYLSR